MYHIEVTVSKGKLETVTRGQSTAEDISSNMTG